MLLCQEVHNFHVLIQHNNMNYLDHLVLNGSDGTYRTIMIRFNRLRSNVEFFFKTMYLEIKFKYKKSCKNKKSTKHTHIPFTQIQ